MPLPVSDPRTLLTRRSIVCEGYEREDGLFDVEGHLQDSNARRHESDWRVVEAGEPIHEMHVRLRLDADMMIRHVDLSMDATPYPICREVTNVVQRLVGLKIAGGFKQRARSLIGHTEGCTHVLALIEVLGTVAIRTVAAHSRSRGESTYEIFGARDRSRPPLIDTCRSYAAWSPIVQKIWPQYYRPRAEQSDADDAPTSADP